MDKVMSRVEKLCKKFPEETSTYQGLVILYWASYQGLASPESICRAYRRLMNKNSIQLDDEPRTLTEVLDSDNTTRKTCNKEE